VLADRATPLGDRRVAPVVGRRIAFQQVFNFRDLGGYPAGEGQSVRWRMLFRADGLNRLQPEEEDAFAALGIATVVDLRTVEEAEHGGRFPALWDVEYHHLPMFDVLPDWPEDIGDPADYVSERHLEMFTAGRKTVARTFELLADPASYPLVFHCAAGKDRTGILAALVLTVLGVPDDVIAADYALSQEAMQRLLVWARSQQGVFAPPRGPVPSVAVEARPETILEFLRKLRGRAGGENGFLSELGIDAAGSHAVRLMLLAG
jgi:protein-tyrosine phosphatase